MKSRNVSLSKWRPTSCGRIKVVSGKSVHSDIWYMHWTGCRRDLEARNAKTPHPARTPHDKGSGREGRGVTGRRRVGKRRKMSSAEMVRWKRPETCQVARRGRHSGPELKKSASTPNTSRDHSNEDDETTNPTRPSEDPGDATGGDECRPNGPAEPPDMLEGTREQGGEQRVEERMSRQSRAHSVTTREARRTVRRDERSRRHTGQARG